ncbi:MAG: hypothetical protein ACPGWR_11790, partial [Ardenticatenaceae bacterium]
KNCGFRKTFFLSSGALWANPQSEISSILHSEIRNPQSAIRNGCPLGESAIRDLFYSSFRNPQSAIRNPQFFIGVFE